MFDDLLEEAFSNASYITVSELRSLYYGRLNVYVSFTDNSRYIMRNNRRPDGILCHAVDVVVGRKATTNLLYGRVFRVRKNAGRFIEDIRNHTNDSLKLDIESLYLLRYLKHSDIDAAVDKVMNNVRIRKAFDRLWEITKELSNGDGKRWAQIFLDLGYIGFTDQRGTGLFQRKREPSTILLDESAKTDLDIVPMQKYRSDPRARIRDDVNKVVRDISTSRNRVAKKPTEIFRGKAKKSFLSDIRDLMKGI